MNRRSKFQSLIGKLQTGILPYVDDFLNFLFQSLIGKLQTNLLIGNRLVLSVFQSLIGKLQTELVNYIDDIDRACFNPL